MLYNQKAFCNVLHRFMRAPLNIKAQGLKLMWTQTNKWMLQYGVFPTKKTVIANISSCQ